MFACRILFAESNGGPLISSKTQSGKPLCVGTINPFKCLHNFASAHYLRKANNDPLMVLFLKRILVVNNVGEESLNACVNMMESKVWRPLYCKHIT